MPQLNAYLFFPGNCAEAMRFYERTFGAKIEMMMRQSESPMAAQCAPGSADLVMHARLVGDGILLMASDHMGDKPYEGMKGFSMSMTYAGADEASKVYDALAEGGQATMPMQKTFWSESFGMLTDRYGTAWMINVVP